MIKFLVLAVKFFASMTKFLVLAVKFFALMTKFLVLAVKFFALILEFFASVFEARNSVIEKYNAGISLKENKTCWLALPDGMNDCKKTIALIFVMRMNGNRQA